MIFQQLDELVKYHCFQKNKTDRVTDIEEYLETIGVRNEEIPTLTIVLLDFLEKIEKGLK